MIKKLKRFYLSMSSLFLLLLYIPITSAMPGTEESPDNPAIPFANIAATKSTLLANASAVYDSLHLGNAGLSRTAFQQAVKGLGKLLEKGAVMNDAVVSIADFSQPSSKKRLYIIDLEKRKVLFHTWVAHGRNSGRERADRFSNRASSYMSSPGFYLTRETYRGKHGYSLRLDGLEKGINDKAFDRAIVIHGAAYVNPYLASAQGYIGRSLGCPAVPEKLATPIINTIRDGSLFFIYHPSTQYQQRSSLLNS